MTPLAETFVIFSHEVRRSVRSAKSLVLLILYGLASTVSGLAFVWAFRSLQAKVSQYTNGQPIPENAQMEIKMSGLSLLFGKDEAVLKSLAEVPLIVIFFFKFACFFLPFLIVLMGFDQLSGELGTRSLRYVVPRVRRGSIVFGKVLAQAAVLFTITAVVNVGLFAYAAATTEGFAVAAGALAMVRFWALTLVYAAAYLGLSSLCSSLFRVPIFSLLTNLSVLFFFWFVTVIAHFSKPFEFLTWITPSHYEPALVHPQFMEAAPSILAYVIFAAAFLGLSWLTLQKRDL